MLRLPKESTDKLKVLEDRMRGLRADKAQAVKVAKVALDAANSAPEGQDNSPQIAAADEAGKAVSAIQKRIDQVTEEQQTLMKTAGGPPVWRSGESGWASAARQLDLDAGALSVDVAGGSLLGPMAATSVDLDTASRFPTREVPAITPAHDARFLHSVFPTAPLDDGELAVVDFRMDSDAVSGMTGTVERDPLATTTKASLDTTVTAESHDARQFAVTLDDVPAKLFDAVSSLTAFLEREARYVLEKALDSHVLAAITTASPPSGSTGTSLIPRVRNAIASAKALGSSPTVLALDPVDAAALDLTTTGADDAYAFLTTASGSSSPLWGLTIVESVTVADPLVIDPQLAGVLYLGNAHLQADPYSGLKQNTVDLRLEFDALCHIRDRSGIWKIA